MFKQAFFLFLSKTRLIQPKPTKIPKRDKDLLIRIFFISKAQTQNFWLKSQNVYHLNQPHLIIWLYYSFFRKKKICLKCRHYIFPFSLLKKKKRYIFPLFFGNGVFGCALASSKSRSTGVKTWFCEKTKKKSCLSNFFSKSNLVIGSCLAGSNSYKLYAVMIFPLRICYAQTSKLPTSYKLLEADQIHKFWLCFFFFFSFFFFWFTCFLFLLLCILL